MSPAADTVVPLDEFVSDELYPGYPGDPERTPVILEPVKPFSKDDERYFWSLDAIHFGHGVMPGSVTLVEDCFAYGTQLAAENVGLPAGRGLRCRLGGTHVYMSPIDTASEWAIGWRASRFGPFLQGFLGSFDELWELRRSELDAAHEHFRSIESSALVLAELGQAIHDAHDYHRRAWTIHFELMYPLLANYLGFYGLSAELGLDPSQVSRFLAGRKHKLLETDEALWALAAKATELGVAGSLGDGDLSGARERILAEPNGSTWWAELDRFLEVYGWRIDENCVINMAPWRDDPTPALVAIRSFHGKGTAHDFEASLKASAEARDEAIEEARAQIGKRAELEAWNTALASCQAANFAWWNDEHNFYIDKRAAVPAHHLTLELGRRLAADDKLDMPEDVFFLFRQEIYEGLDDPSAWKKSIAHVPSRKDYFTEWRAKLRDLPTVVGTVPKTVGDPILIEIFGLSSHYLETVQADEPTEVLRGLPASRGVVEGNARVIMASTDLHELQPGEILVCRGTDPDWTPAFGYIKACVCDGGGSLTHAAIISREYGIPCVVGTGVATSNITTGDRLKVDGGKGVVEVRA